MVRGRPAGLQPALGGEERRFGRAFGPLPASRPSPKPRKSASRGVLTWPPYCSDLRVLSGSVLEAPVTVLLCFADFGRCLEANWLAQRVVFTKTQSGKQIFFLPLWVLYKITYRTSHLALRHLPKSAKHDSTVTGASKTDYPQIRKSPQYGGQGLLGGPSRCVFALFWGGSGGGKRAEGTPERPFLAEPPGNNRGGPGGR